MINQQRHIKSNAVIATDIAALNKYKMERKLHRQVMSLTKELEEVKITLARVCEKLEKVEN